jgi:tetratricopeptide (TPR) repeat protein
MSDRQTLAQFGVGLCLAGLAAWAAPIVVPIAILGALLLDLRGKCDKRLARTAVEGTLAALTDTPDLTDDDIRTARAWLDHRRADLRLDPVALASAAQNRTLPDALFDLIVDDTLARDGGARRAVHLALTAAFQTCRTHENFHLIFTQEMLIGLSQSHGLIQQKLDRVKEDTTSILAKIAGIEEMLAQRLQSDQPQTYVAHTTMIIGLAGRYARNPDGTPITDFDAAYAGLENALQVAETLRAQNALPRNATDQIDAVLAHVQTLNDAAEFDRADAALADARAAAQDRIAEQTSGLMRLWDSTVAQATLRNRPDLAADALVERLMLDTPADPFAALRALQDDWYERGRDKGLAFDATVAIHLADHSLTFARTRDQRGMAQNDLGLALSILGAREAGPARLGQAVAAFAEALKERTRDPVPLDWAMTQNNLGNALQTLGEREAGTVRLEQAVAAFAEALKEYTRDRVPLDWAFTQGNLALVEIAFFDKTADPAHLTAARAYVMAAREVFMAAGADHYVGMADEQLSQITTRETP